MLRSSHKKWALLLVLMAFCSGFFGLILPVFSKQPLDRQGLLIEEFLNAAFPDLTESRQYFSGVRPDHLLSSDFYQQQYPWLESYIYRDNNPPRFEFLHKRESDTGVALFWPSFGKGRLNIGHLKDDQKQSLEMSIKNAVSEQNEYSDIKYRFVSEDEDARSNSDYARVRIIPMYYSDDPLAPHSWEESCHANAIHICSIDVAIKFPSLQKNDVDGFSVPERNNSLGLSVCYVDLNASDTIIRNQIDICLFKSLGLPGFLGSSDHTKVIKKKKFMAKILSCPEIKSGMTKLEITEYLKDSSGCLRDFKNRH